MAHKTKAQRRQWVWVYLTRWMLAGMRGRIMQFINSNAAFLSGDTHRTLTRIHNLMHTLEIQVNLNYKNKKPLL